MRTLKRLAAWLATVSASGLVAALILAGLLSNVATGQGVIVRDALSWFGVPLDSTTFLATAALTTNATVAYNGSGRWVTSTLGGDVSGAVSAISVNKVNGHSFNVGAIASSQVLQESGGALVPKTIGGDLGGAAVASTTVTGIQGRVVDSTAPTEGQVYVYRSIGKSVPGFFAETPAGGATINPTTSIVKIGTGLGAVRQFVGPTDQQWFGGSPNVSVNVTSKDVTLSSGDSSGASGNTGDVHISTGASPAGSTGDVILDPNEGAGSGGRIWFRLNGGNTAQFNPADQVAVPNAGVPSFTAHNRGGLQLGEAQTGFAAFYLDYTNTATVGNVTINMPSGTVKMAALASTLTVTNSLATANSHILVTMAGDPGVAASVWTVSAAGSFTINTRPALTNQTPIDFIVIGAD